MNTDHCDTEFRWVKHDIEVIGRPNPTLQTRTVTHGFSELNGVYSHATPWRDVPVLSEAEAAKLDAPPTAEERAIATLDDDRTMRAIAGWLIVASVVIGIVLVIVLK